VDGWKTEIAVDCWLSALKLLQDDESTTRALVREAVQIALTTAAAATSSKNKSKLLATAQPRSASDTLVLPLAVAYVVDHFANTTYGSLTLSKLFMSFVDAPATLREYTSSSDGNQDWGELCDRIFEAESSNYFAEPDLVAQLFVYHVFVANDASSQQQRARSNSSGLFGFGGSSSSSSSSPPASNDALATVLH
ncbi:Cell cycle-associated protein, partial [Globisporangium polare]